MKKLASIFLMFVSSSTSVFAGWPVFDIANWYQNGEMLVKQAAQYRNQVAQYNNQLNQYQNMLNNTKSLTSFQWDNANLVIDNLLRVTNVIDGYKQEAGSLTRHLDQYKSSEQYLKSACFTGHCTKAEMQKIEMSRFRTSVAQKRANDAIILGLDQQQQNIKKDAEALKVLQSKAQTAEGQKQTLQAATQLASNQTNQLLQIRSLMITQQNGQAARDAAKANREAIFDAGDSRFKSGEYHKSVPKQW